jgi:hypothetical protein
MERQIMGILAELKTGMEEPGIKGQLATQLHDITEQYNDGILTDVEYKDLVTQIGDVQANDDLANDEVTSRWVVNITQLILSAV